MSTTDRAPSAAERRRRDAAVERIAAKVLRLPTLAARNSDSLDFHDVAVWTLKDALDAAYDAGRAAAGRTRRTQ